MQVMHYVIHLPAKNSERFRLPRGQNRSSSSIRPLPRGTNGCFVPYTTAAKVSKSKAKSDIIIKDVCLLPSSCWKEVPKRQIKLDLINRNLFIDAWSLDKSWSEQQLRLELFNLFKNHLSGPTEYVKTNNLLIEIPCQFMWDAGRVSGGTDMFINFTLFANIPGMFAAMLKARPHFLSSRIPRDGMARKHATQGRN